MVADAAQMTIQISSASKSERSLMVLVLACLAVAETTRQDGALESTASQGLG
jgi:hypothetical protein